MSSKLKNFAAAICAALFALIFALAFSIGYFDCLRIMHFCVVAVIGASSASLIFFRYLGRRAGLLGVLQDLGIVAVEVFVAIIIAGTLVVPILGTILAPLFIYTLVNETPSLGGIVAIGMASALLLSRVREHK